MAFGDAPDRKVQVGALLGGLALGIPAVIQNPEDRFFGFVVFGTVGALMGAGLTAIFVPTTCPVPDAVERA